MQIETSLISEKENYQTFTYILDTSPSKELFLDYKKLNTTIKIFIQNLPILNQKQLKKLFIITINNEINIQDLVILTRENDRNTRLLSTVCVLNKIKVMLTVNKKNLNEICELILNVFDEVFMKRCKDVDGNIRAACYEYLSVYIKCVEMFRKKEFFRYFIDGLEDKTEVVRKQILGDLIELFKTLDERIGKTMFEALNDKIFIACKNEKNLKIRSLASSLCLLFYKKRFCDHKEVLKSITFSNQEEAGLFFNEIKLERGVLVALNDIYEIKKNVLELIKINNEEMHELLTMIDSESEASSNFICILKLVIKEDQNYVQEIKGFLKKYKDDPQNLINLLDTLLIIGNDFYTIEHVDLVESVFDLRSHTNEDVLKKMFLFLKLKNESYASKIEFFIENLKYEKNSFVIQTAIQMFDVSDAVSKNDPLEVQVLSIFWKLKNSGSDPDYDFEKNLLKNHEKEPRIETLKIITEIDFIKACNYLMYCYKCLETDISQDVLICYDPITAVKILFNKLTSLITEYIENLINKTHVDTFDFKERIKKRKCKKEFSKPIIDAYISIAHIIDNKPSIIFYSERHQVLEFIKNVKAVDDLLLTAFFTFTKNVEVCNLSDIKIIAVALSKNVKSNNIYKHLEECIDKTSLYDNCLIYFVKYLSRVECVDLCKALLVDCRFKKEMQRRILEDFKEEFSDLEDEPIIL